MFPAVSFADEERREEKLNMAKLRKVVPDVNGTFGRLTFAGPGEENMGRVNGRRVALTREYNLYSSFQRAENVLVRIPGGSGVKTFDYEEQVKLVNPRLIAEGYAINDRGLVNYVLLADDIVKA